MNEEQRQMDLALAECEAENRLLRARNERLMKEVDLLTEALRGKQEPSGGKYTSFGLMGGDDFVNKDSLKRSIT
jgi:hypothetical protein